MTDSKNLFIGVAVGFLSGLAVALGGAIKDSPYEGFDPVKFMRSPIIGAIEGGAINSVIQLHPEILFLSVIGAERITTETYKLLRAKMPMKFKYGEWNIPKIRMRR